MKQGFCSDPERARTSGLQIRNLSLYPLSYGITTFEFEKHSRGLFKSPDASFRKLKYHRMARPSSGKLDYQPADFSQGIFLSPSILYRESKTTALTHSNLVVGK
jgi:hypothetical protein